MSRYVAGLAVFLVWASVAVADELPANVFTPGAATTALMLPEDVFFRAPDDDRVDAVLIGATRVAVVRLQVTVGGQGFRRSWGDFAVRLHRFLDRDDNGVVTLAEANQTPWTNVLQNIFNGRRNPFQLATKAVPLDADKDGMVTVEELLMYLRSMQDADALGVRPGALPDDRIESIFAHLDRNGDQVISTEELAATPSLLDRLDRDEDEMIDLDELTPDRAVSTRRFVANADPSGKVDGEKSQVMVTALDVDRLKLARRIATRFNAAPAKAPPAIAPATLGLSAEAARAFDSDRDGLLRAEEIAAYLKDPTPALTLSTALSAPDLTQRRPQNQVAFTIVNVATGSRPDGLSVKMGDRANIVISFQGAEIEWYASDQANLPGVQFLEQQFDQADGDKSGTIDAKEARENFFLQQVYTVADRNGNGKLTREELKVYVTLNADAIMSKTLVTLADGGSTLHMRLDSDNDERLSLRELRLASDHLRELDLNHDGGVQRAELPRRSIVTVGRDDGRNGVVRVLAQRNQTANAASATAPVWFARMDRNRDGDVSPQEFLGPTEHFRRFDADGDGLINSTEAARVP
jgi:Ca2+-binding EF-hand superfamily protein